MSRDHLELRRRALVAALRQEQQYAELTAQVRALEVRVGALERSSVGTDPYGGEPEGPRLMDDAPEAPQVPPVSLTTSAGSRAYDALLGPARHA